MFAYDRFMGESKIFPSIELQYKRNNSSWENEIKNAKEQQIAHISLLKTSYTR